MIKLNPPCIDVESTMPIVEEVLRSGTLTQGSKVYEFERLCGAMADTSHAVAVSNATVGLELLLSLLGRPGDEVITTAFTFKATVNAVLRSGRRPVLVDIGSDYLINTEHILEAITDKTTAIIVVHLYGYPVDVEYLKVHTDIPIIEDASQAHGSRINGQPVGGLGHAGVFSFYATKNIAAGEGGVITTNNAALAGSIRSLINHEKLTHSTAYPTNARMSELQAAVAIPQLKRLDWIISTRRSNAFHLLDYVDNLQSGERSKYHNYHLFTIEDDSPAKLSKFLLERGIESKSYYRYPMESHYITGLPVYALDMMYKKAARVLSVPVHQGLTSLEIEQVGEAICEYREKAI